MIPSTQTRTRATAAATAATLTTVARHLHSASDNDNIERFQKRYHLKGGTTPNNTSGATVVFDTGHTLQTDLPYQMGGQASAPQPIELLLAALAGCTQATALFVGRRMLQPRLLLERLEFDWTALRDERGALLARPLTEEASNNNNGTKIPSRLHTLTGTVRVFAVNNTPMETETIDTLKELTERHCPVANMMIASGCDVSGVQWVDGNMAAAAVVVDEQ